MKDIKSIILAILFLIFIVCGCYGTIEIIKGLFGEIVDLIGSIFY